MLKVIFLISCLTALAASAALEEALSVQFVAKDKLEAFLKKNPEAVKLELKESNEDSPSADQEKRLATYTLGRRQNGDTLVGRSVSDGVYSWNSPQNPYVSIGYPSSGVGKIVTYLQIIIAQSSNSGEAYLTGGGIGQRQISFVAIAYQTYYFGWDVQVYGK